MHNPTYYAYMRFQNKRKKTTRAMNNRKFANNKKIVYNMRILLNSTFSYKSYLIKSPIVRHRKRVEVTLNNKNIYCGKIYYIKKRIPIQEYLGID